MKKQTIEITPAHKKVFKMFERYAGRGGNIYNPAEGFIAWCKDCVKIESGSEELGTKVSPFILWPAQEEVVRKLFSGKKFFLILKARQLGLTTLCLAFFLWRAIFLDAQDYRCISINEDLAKELKRDKLDFMYKNLPIYLKPALAADNTSTMRFAVTEGMLKMMPTTAVAGRSETTDGLLSDEDAMNPFAKDIRISAIPSLEKRGGFYLKVSTADGYGNDFEQEWHKAVRGESLFEPIFLPWMADPNRDQKWYDQMLRENGQEFMHQEYPAAPEEAFLASGRPFFDMARLGRFLADKERPFIQGYLYKGRFVKSQNGSLKIWKAPKKDHSYAIFGDVARGLESGDWSIWDVEDMATNEQVAELRLHCDTHEFAALGFELGIFYKTALLAPEDNDCGIATAMELQFLRYPNLYYDRNPITGRVNFQPGFNTNVKTRRLVLARMQADFRLGKVHVNSKTCFQEMSTFAHHKSTGKPQAQEGCHDDCVMARAGAHWLAVKLPYFKEKRTVLEDLQENLGMNIHPSGVEYWANHPAQKPLVPAYVEEC
jgi:hypothetical protein